MKKIFHIIAAMLASVVAIAQPAYDNPCGAIALTPTASCSYTTYTWTAATATSGVPAPGCASYTTGDVWFKVVVPANGAVTVDLTTGTITDSGMAIYSATGGSCPGTAPTLALIECDDDDSANGAMSMIALTGRTSGETLYIRVWDYDDATGGSLGICATTPAPACNISAVTASGAAGCNNNGTATNLADDYFTADITVTFANKPGSGTLALSGAGIHSGTNSVAVASTTTSTTHIFTGVKIKAIGSVQTITAAFSADAGCTFTNSAIPVLSGCGIAQGSTTCATPSKLCTNVGQTLTFGATVGAANASVTNPGNNYGCLSSSPRPSWFYVQMQTGGSIDITLQGYSNTNAVVDNDFALWGPFANLAAAQAACNTYGANIDCSYAAGTGSEAVNIPVTATAGQVFVLLVTAYSDVSSYFTLLQTGGTGSTECSGVAGACDISAVTATPSACAAGLYGLTGTATFVNPPVTGNLLIKVDGVLKQTIAVSASPMSYSVTGLTADGASHTVQAEFSAVGTCLQTQTYTSPPACSACSAGNMTLNITTP